MENKNNKTRRSFLRNATKGALVAAIAPTAFAKAENETHFSTNPGILGANDRIRVAVLGVNGRGKTHIEVIMELAEKSNVNWWHSVIPIWWC
jgi:hypothetical protein